jgi:hypothetical protein
MITSVYAQCIPEPCFCECRPTGFTPGFWKHNLRVYLQETNGKYSAFSRDGYGPYYFTAGTHLTNDIIADLIDDINFAIGSSFDAGELLAFLNEKGWSENRINTANWFNKVAGYGPF